MCEHGVTLQSWNPGGSTSCLFSPYRQSWVTYSRIWDWENSLCLCNCACLGDRQESAWASCRNRLPTSRHAGSQHQGR